ARPSSSWPTGPPRPPCPEFCSGQARPRRGRPTGAGLSHGRLEPWAHGWSSCSVAGGAVVHTPPARDGIGYGTRARAQRGQGRGVHTGRGVGAVPQGSRGGNAGRARGTLGTCPDGGAATAGGDRPAGAVAQPPAA